MATATRFRLTWFQCAGISSITWDARDDQGREVATGVYLLQLSSAGVRRSGKVVVVR